MATEQTTPTREIKKDTVVDLPRYLRGARLGERVGIVQRLLDAEESPLGVASAIIQVMGGYKFNRTMGEPVLIALSEISRKRMHANCETCICSLPNEEETEVDIEDDEDDDEDETDV